MAHPLQQRIARLRSHARRLLVVYALGWTIVWAVAALLIVAFADYLIRFQDHGIRLMASLGVLLVFVWACRRFAPAVLKRRLGDLEIAKRVERRFPALDDRLASTIEFLKQPEADPQAGSAALRRAVILETASQAESLDFSEIFDARPAWRALWAAGAVGLVAVGIALASPDAARIGLSRLARPFGNDAWPRHYSVVFRNTPTRLAAGQSFEVELLEDAEHRVPQDVRVYYRYETASSGVEQESEPMRLVGGALVARKESVTRPFWYRAEGGDDLSMDWIRLEVIEPPRLESLQLTLRPPDYSGLATEPSEKNIHALRGTRVGLVGTATKKLRKATVCQEGNNSLTAELTSDGYGFELPSDATQPFVVDRSRSYWIALEDGEGLVGGAADRWDVRAITDQAPSVTVEQPAGNIFVTPHGEVTMRVSAKDDLAIHEIALHFSRSDRTDVEDFMVPLHEGPPGAAPRSEPGLLIGGHLGESQTVEHRWLLSELGLKPGTQVTFWATASDYLPQTGKSPARRLSIVTPQELEDRLAQRQMLIFGELERVLKLQQDARLGTKSLEIQIEHVGRLNKQDVDRAQSAELNQRQVNRSLTSPSEGIPAQITDFLADLNSNRVDNPDIQRHMAAVLDELDRLAQEHLVTIDRELTSVIKAAQSGLSKDAGDDPKPASAGDPLLAKSLTAAASNQDQVIVSLEKMLGELAQWDNYRRFAGEIARIERDQQEIARATSEMAPKTLGRELKDLDAQQQADLKKLAGQQAELSRRLEKVQQQMSQIVGSLTDTNPLSAATISDGLHHAQKQAISGQMRQSGQQLEKNQLGQAARVQAKAVKDLEDLMAILSNRREQELTRLVKQLREAEQEMARMRAEQAGLRKQMRAAADKPDAEGRRQLERLAREQKKLEEEAARLSRRLERLQAEQASRSTAGAAGKMARVGDAGQQGDAGTAEQQAQRAQRDLEEAQQQLAARRRAAEEDLAREQMARMEDALKSLHERQKKLLQDTQRLENLRATEGRLTRAQLTTVGDAARWQKSLEGETALLAEKLALAEVIHMALDGAGRQMARAAELLDHRETGAATQGAQEAARLRIAQLLAAVENKPKAGGDAGDGGGSGGGAGPQGDANQLLAQLKLLKILQEDLNTRYRAAAGARDDATPAGEQLAQIASEQGKLAELALKLAQPLEASPEDDPDALPDVRKQGIDPTDAGAPGELEGRTEAQGKEPS